ncbi:MAG: hypothetical protein BGO78_10795 [Chloroflexi bacterium 44-23]|nr:MAG: hypothetical protein BGO78_10795 [Chloroflexi bacterium 44-23]
MNTQYSRSVGDYLKAIHTLTLNNEQTSPLNLAEALQVAPSSVTSMLKKLSSLQPALVDYQKSYGVSLTEEGKLAALRLIRRHRLLEEFLSRVMEYDWEDVHAEADELEHVISPRFEDKLANLLGDPQFDPHGDPIPGRDLSMPLSTTIPLAELKENKDAIIRRVHASQEEMFQHLGQLGLRPGSHIRVLSRNPLDFSIQFILDDKGVSQVIGHDLSSVIFVDEI